MTRSAPLISVIMPVHNVAGHVGDTIASLRAQTLGDFEAIVVDDGSSDGSAAIARAAAEGDARFHVIRQANRGPGGARNTGLDAAAGSFIAFIDGDDRFVPVYLERLYGVLEATGADWVACASRNIHPDGTTDVHSTIHGAPELPRHSGSLRYPLDDWRAVIRHFPSVWNKLYRRSLIDGLRFDEKTWFQDHAFYYRAAERTDHIEYLPEPLYLQTRGRNGQITASDEEQVFQQFSVLETLETIISASNKPGGAEAFARIASRLVYERSTTVRDRDRRARFAAAARDFFKARDLPWRPDWDVGIGRAWELTMSGLTPVSVIIPYDGASGRLAATLESLAAQTLPDAEVLVVADADVPPPEAPGARVLTQADRGPGPARDHGLAQARGEFVVFVDAGDTLLAHALEYWINRLLRESADFGFSGYRIGHATCSGLHDTTPVEPGGGLIPLSPSVALAIDAHPSTWIFRRSFLDKNGIRFGAAPFAEWRFTLQAAHAAASARHFPGADVVLSESPVPAHVLARGIDAIAASPEAGRLPPGWQRRLFARVVAQKVRFAEYRAPGGALWFLATAAIVARLRGWAWQEGTLDPDIGPRMRRAVAPGTVEPPR